MLRFLDLKMVQKIIYSFVHIVIYFLLCHRFSLLLSNELLSFVFPVICSSDFCLSFLTHLYYLMFGRNSLSLFLLNSTWSGKPPSLENVELVDRCESLDIFVDATVLNSMISFSVLSTKPSKRQTRTIKIWCTEKRSRRASMNYRRPGTDTGRAVWWACIGTSCFVSLRYDAPSTTFGT